MKKRRSAAKPIIGHLKSDHLMSRNRLGGKDGDEFNPILSGAAFNLKKMSIIESKSFMVAFVRRGTSSADKSLAASYLTSIIFLRSDSFFIE